MARIKHGWRLALGAGMLLAAATGACDGGDFHRVGTIGDGGSAGAPDAKTGGSAGSVEQGAGSGGRQGEETKATAGGAGVPDGVAGEAGSSGNPTDRGCDNGVKDGTETDVDCGGQVCTACAQGKTCVAATDCRSRVCDAQTCAASECADAVWNGDETDADCGGPVCAKCEVGQTCLLDADCVNSVCTDGICAGCDDRVQNGDESGLDCGGERCPACDVGNTCRVAADCIDGVCTSGTCRSETCTDGVQNGDETDIDCGGECGRCRTGQSCAAGTDCEASVCDQGVCAEATCQDAVENGDESDVDCGGSVCPACTEGEACKEAADCDGGDCFAQVCLPSPVASRQTVTFRVHNGADAPRALQVEGSYCSAFAIYRLEGETATLVNREVRYSDAYCINVDNIPGSELQWVPAGETHELSWDAREEQIVHSTIDCREEYPDAAEPGRGSVSVPVGIPRPVDAGEYRVDVAYLVGAPDEEEWCFTDHDGSGISCYEFESNMDSHGDICDIPLLERMGVPFTLPQTGDVTVDIELS